MSDNLGYLFAAFAISWVGIAAYVFYVSSQVRALQDDIERLDEYRDAASQ